MTSQDESVLLERVFLRIGSAETDEQLENALMKFLPPILLKLSSSQEHVRKKVMELLVHINKRLKSRPQIQLPMESLLMQYGDPSATSFSINFTIIYLKLGYPRMEIDKQIKLIPNLLSCIENKPRQHQESILNLLVPILQHVKIPSNPEECKFMFGLHEKPKVAAFLNEFLLDFLLLPYGPFNISSGLESNVSTPPGLSPNSFKKVLGENPPNPEQLEQYKLGVIKFITCGIYSEVEIVPHLVIATSDTRHSVASAADLQLRRLSGTVDWNNKQLVSKLYSIFLGTTMTKNQIQPELQKTPANTRIRLKIFPCFLKSEEASMTIPSSVQVIFESIYGENTNMKLKTMALQFVHFMCTKCSQERLNLVATVIMSGMLKLVTESNEEPQIKSMAYVAVGMLATKLPNLVTKNIAMVQTFFDALTKEVKDVRISIQESLSLLAKAFCSMDQNTQCLMESLISTSIENPEPQVRQMALHYAATIFPPDHIPSRFILLLAAGDSNEEVKAAAIKALHNVTHRENNEGIEQKCLYPSFSAFVDFLSKKISQRTNTSSKTVGSKCLPFNVATYIEVIHFARCCLAYAAGVSTQQILTRSNWTNSVLITKYINDILNEEKSLQTTSIDKYLASIIQLLEVHPEPMIVFNCLEVIAASTDTIINKYKDHLNLFKKLMFSTREEVREYASQLVALVISSTDDDCFVVRITELINNIKCQNFEEKHGSLVALGYTLGRTLYLLKHKDNSNFQSFLQATWASDAVKLIASLIQSKELQLSNAACLALGEIARNGPLPLADDEICDREIMDQSENLFSSKLSLVNLLGALLKENQRITKLYERAAITLGYLCVGDEKFPFNKNVIDYLLQTAYHDMDIDVHFSVGEALACACLGSFSPAATDIWTVDRNNFKVQNISTEMKLLQWLLTEILQKFIVHTKTSVRQAACVWLITLLKQCGNQQIMKIQLPTIQNALMNLLADSNDIIQDIAAKGLSMIYEIGDETNQQELLSVLVDALTSGRKSAITITDETKLFNEDLLGNSPSGGGLSTYKELCAVASDLNQPELIYKFMHLANHNAVWNSKKGAAFGFGIIAQQARSQLKEYLPIIVPKLYRYQFDPNSSVRLSLISIWHAIVQDEQKTIDLYLNEIIKDIACNLTSPQWRIRESCCLALSDLLRGRNIENIIDYFPELWEKCFRLRDDIKETVRNAANTALKTLSKICIKFCDANLGKSSEKMLTVILPVLVRSGLTSNLAEIREISLSTIVQISRKAGLLLKPHLALLFMALLESLSINEPDVINYLSNRLDETSQEKLDIQRVSVFQKSPMMETINFCVQYVDDDVLKELIPRLTELIRSSVALGTKSGCSNFVITLLLQCPQELQQYSGKLLSAFISGLNDRNGAVRRSYAKAIGHLVRISKESSVSKVIERIQMWYLEKEEDYVHTSCVYTLHSMALHSPDIFRKHLTEALPLVFFAMHRKSSKENEDLQLLWKEMWSEFTTNTESGILLYIDEILSIIQKGLESQSWFMKQQAADCLVTLAKNVGNKLDQKIFHFIQFIISALSGRIWKGKESLLQALTAICIYCLKSIQEHENSDLMKEVVETLLRECRKENLYYKIEALKGLGEILEKYEMDYFSELYSILLPAITKDQSKSNASDDDQQSDRGSDIILQFHQTIFQILGQVWPLQEKTQIIYRKPLCMLFVSEFDASTWKIQLSILKSVKTFISRLKISQDRVPDSVEEQELISIIDGILNIGYKASGMSKYSTLRIEALNVIKILLIKLKDNNSEYLLIANSRIELKNILKSLKEDGNHQIKEKASELIKILDELST